MSTLPSVFIPCPQCEATVQASVLAEHEHAGGEDSDPYKYQFVECSQCHTSMVGLSELEWHDVDGHDWGRPTRQWPLPERALHPNIPASVRLALEEAKKCFTCNAFMACAVMCGKAIEGLCKSKVNAKYLGEGLGKLKAAKIIDDKLFEWGEALRIERNIGAHAGETTTSRQTANDVLDFALAIAEYVYVLDEKFESYKARKAKKLPPPPPPPALI